MSSSLDNPPFPISLLAMVIFGLSSMLDSGNDVTFNDVKSHAKSGDLVEFLKERAGGIFAANILDSHANFRKWYTDQIATNCGAMAGREGRKYGVQRSGLCLLISYTAEILQSDRAPVQLTNHSRSPVMN